MDFDTLVFGDDGNGDLGGSDDFTLDADNGMVNICANGGTPEGFDDLFAGDNALAQQDKDYVQGPVAKRTCPAFSGRSTKAAERSALRSKFDEGDALILKEDRNLLIPTASSRVPGTFGRRNREKGSTLPAYRKKVSHELDSDDGIMMDTREKGYSDRQIADKLVKEGIRYDQKSIATRITRIRIAQAEHVDYLLQEGYKEWRLEDVSPPYPPSLVYVTEVNQDELLMQAYDLADIEIRYEMERLRAWRFKKVSEHIRRLNKEALFSAKACRDRYAALVNGTAIIPTDQDDNPDARRLEMETYRQEREAARAAEPAKKEKKEAEQQRIKDETRARGVKKAAETAARRNKMAQEKADRAVKRAAQASVRAQRALENDKKKAGQHASYQKKEDGKNKERSRARAKACSLATIKDVIDGSSDPRANLSFTDLQKLCKDRKLSTEARRKTELLSHLMDADQQLTSVQLKSLIQRKGIGLGGTESRMRYQLAVAAAFDCPSYQGPGAAANGDEDDGNNEAMDDVVGELGDKGNNILSDRGVEFD
jgi:hypothetical protein